MDRGRSPGTGELAAGLDAHRVLLVCGGQSARRSGLLDRVEQSLIQAGLACRVFAGIHPNPRLFQVCEGVQTALEFGADLILAVGGGSVIDAAKAIALGRCGARGRPVGLLAGQASGGAHPSSGGSAHHLRRRERDQLLRRAHPG